MGRYRNPVYAKDSTAHWVAVFGLQWQVILKSLTAGGLEISTVFGEHEIIWLISLCALPDGLLILCRCLKRGYKPW
jgi:hypothetical protein